MVKMTKEVVEALSDPTTLKTLVTVDTSGTPNGVIIGTLTALDDQTIIFADLRLGKSKENLLNNGSFTVNVTGKDLSSYQIKGKFKEYQDRTPLAEQWNEAVYGKIKMQIRGVVLGQVEEVYSASLKDAGKRLA